MRRHGPCIEISQFLTTVLCLYWRSQEVGGCGRDVKLASGPSAGFDAAGAQPAKVRGDFIAGAFARASLIAHVLDIRGRFRLKAMLAMSRTQSDECSTERLIDLVSKPPSRLRSIQTSIRFRVGDSTPGHLQPGNHFEDFVCRRINRDQIIGTTARRQDLGIVGSEGKVPAAAFDGNRCDRRIRLGVENLKVIRSRRGDQHPPALSKATPYGLFSVATVLTTL